MGRQAEEKDKKCQTKESFSWHWCILWIQNTNIAIFPGIPNSIASAPIFCPPSPVSSGPCAGPREKAVLGIWARNRWGRRKIFEDFFCSYGNQLYFCNPNENKVKTYRLADCRERFDEQAERG